MHSHDPPPPPPDNFNHPPRAYGYEQERQKSEDDMMDKVGLALGGLVAAGGVAAAMHAYNVCTLINCCD